ncbi:MAG TPA: adenylate/guanylate cyclase domain-containing protein [Pyrinomonadaceae bacterium]|nr:adenylate/guanylate cyclase domain-containing protein [Pyrinomonadaceae bacterium]
MLEQSDLSQIPPGFELHRVLQGHKYYIFRVAWSPDGKRLGSGGYDGTVRVWDTENGRLLHTLKGHAGGALSVAWSPDGRSLASGGGDSAVRVWDATTGELSFVLEGHSGWVYGVAWSPSKPTLASGGYDGSVRVWDAAGAQLLHTLTGHIGGALSVAWSPNGQYIASGGSDGTVRVWDARAGKLLYMLRGHAQTVYSVAWWPDGLKLISAGRDGTIRVWNVRTGKLSIVLEGHTSRVQSISISPDGRHIASKSGDGTVRLWRCDTGETIAILNETPSKFWPPGLAFDPEGTALATLGTADTVIRIWDLNFKAIRRGRSTTRGVSYTNAKVVLVGETGVGKTGLGVRLAEGVWRPTPGSTHGMNVWPLHSETEREVMLWDFAGQDEYRLVHQLFLNETNVALMLYDPTKSNDTFEGIEYWEKALRNVVRGDVRKILVAARVDVGGVRMTAADIEAYCKAHGFAAHFATSAETGEGCGDLRAAIMTAIPWESLPRTSSPEIFKRIKDFLAAVRQGRRVLVREDDLLAEFNAQAGEDAPTEAEFRTVIGHVETAGLIKRLSFGDFVLLKPEFLNGYASDIVDAARRHPDGLGAVGKSDVLDARIRLKNEGGLKSSDRIFLLHATVELFLRLGLALEQDDNLVFPSKFNRRMPPLEEDPAVEVEFSFEGPVENLYTTLVVKLYYGGIFRLKKLWKNAAEFLNARGLVCGFQLQNEGEGQGTLKVFYAEGVRDDDKALFLKIVADHFRDKRVEVRRQRIYRCPHCREPVRDRQAIERALERQVKGVPCLYCFKSFPLMDALEVLYHDDEKFLAQIAEMESRAEASMERGGEMVSAAAELRTENFKSWAGGAGIATVAIVFTDVVGSTGLNVEFGDEPWRQVREAHFARAKELVTLGRGYLIKTIGDSVMAAFHSADGALDFALALQRDTGHESVRIRAGIHIGPIEVSSGDAFGQQVSMAARVESKAERGGVWVSAKVKEDVDMLRSSKHRRLKWTEHADEDLKGFTQKYTLWSVEE